MLHIFEKDYDPGCRIPAHTHEHASMSIVVRGALRERAGPWEEVARPFSISLMPAGARHVDEISPRGARLLQIHFDDQSARDYSAAGRLEHWRWMHCGPGVSGFLRLLSGVRIGLASHVIEQLVADTIAAVSTRGPASVSSAPPRWLQLVRELIDDSPQWPHVTELAHAAGVHRVHLARRFRDYFGCSVSTYIRRRNVQRAADLMRAEDRTLLEIAHCTGFSDQAHFTRAFASEAGVTPGAFRRSEQPTRPSSI